MAGFVEDDVHSKHDPFDEPGKPLTGVFLLVGAFAIVVIFPVEWVSLIVVGIFILWGVAEFIPQTALRSYMRAIGMLGIIVLGVLLPIVWIYQLLHYLIMRWF